MKSMFFHLFRQVGHICAEGRRYEKKTDSKGSGGGISSFHNTDRLRRGSEGRKIQTGPDRDGE